MRSRRPRVWNAAAGVLELALLEVRSDTTRVVHLSHGRAQLFCGEEGWEMTITASEDGRVEVRASANAALRLNDVEVRGTAVASVGDLISLPDRSVMIQRFTLPTQPSFPVASHEVFELRLIEEVRRAAAGRGPIAVLVVHSMALLGEGLEAFLSAPEFESLRRAQLSFFLGLTAPGTVGLLFPGSTPTDANDARDQLSEALRRLGMPFRWGWGCAPSEALEPSTLWGRALDRLFSDQCEPADDLPHLDPVMVRLCSLADVWAGMSGGVLVRGEVGSGRETFARLIHERRQPQAPFVVLRSAVFDGQSWRSSLERARGGSLYVRHLDSLPTVERASFWQATAFRPMAAAEESTPLTPPVAIAIPALRDRPMDIRPIAEYVFARAHLEGLIKPTLLSTIRHGLFENWVKSVRDLKNTVQRATLFVDASGEMLSEHLGSSAARFVQQRDAIFEFPFAL